MRRHPCTEVNDWNEFRAAGIVPDIHSLEILSRGVEGYIRVHDRIAANIDDLKTRSEYESFFEEDVNDALKALSEISDHLEKSEES
jgi:uncharacterized protein Smg (DUF494 family)